MNPLEQWPLVVPGLALAVPAILVVAALAPPSPRSATRAARVGAVALGLALLVTVGTALAPGAAPRLGVRVDAVTCAMLLLVAGIGLVIIRYSRTYLDGDPGLARYLRWLLLTLAAVTSLVIANNLLIIAIAWTATSLALHQLLTFYADRPAALIAAHKKFLVSRFADACLWTCLALIQTNVGSLELDRIAAWANATPALTPSMQLAAVLVVLAVALKSAQLPFHGWLIQVMEAPTPVSALLHAGIVNIGGFVMIRLAPLMAHAAPAQLLLVGLGLTSALIAALVMTTRISVKVALAWSTCAQMGLMLVQCGLGAWHLALLHLVAHSLYKAHAFLESGSAVDRWRLHALRARAPRPSWRRLGASAAIALGGAALGLAIADELAGAGGLEPLVLAILVALAMVPLIASTGAGGARALAMRVVGVALLYIGWHAVAARLVPPAPSGAWHTLGWALVGAGFLALFAVQSTLARRPDGRLAQTLYPWLFAGLYLDELFTRLTFRVWPPRLPRSEAPRVITLEAHGEA
ncbi:MAG: NADH-quinone oxidoreductase subunit L [Deltaproteobacteria bacterium]|nr:NADH-quinone oxidoreductase subunit L [Deltaproteobacteria bacterium]